MNIEMNSAFQRHKFHLNFEKYVNGGSLSRRDILISLISSTEPFRRNAPRILQQYQYFNCSIPIDKSVLLSVQVDKYTGKNTHVLKMMKYLGQHFKDDLVGAYVHGSLGTYEETAYSDFDALVILKNNVFESSKLLAKVAMKLNTARSIMFDYDPLQHHGWFVLTEVDLKYYCNAYFPIELFKHAKSLFDDMGLELEIALRESGSEARKAFEKMANAIIRNIENRQYPTNVYQLKGLLSQFMLLPALYVQAKHGKGIYKKESFGVARSDFGSADWAIMDEVSEIRAGWSYGISPLQKWLMGHPHVLSRYYAKRFGPQIPEMIGSVLTAEFYSRMKKLAVLMKEMPA